MSVEPNIQFVFSTMKVTIVENESQVPEFIHGTLNRPLDGFTTSQIS